MRDYLLFYLNDHRCEIRGEAAFLSLAEFLRQEQRLTGTKVVCAEGDCGACTVLLGHPDGERLRYEVVNSCILFLYQLDGKHVVTVEGLQANGEPHPVQRAMIDCHGSQCGYCTPGFVCSLAGLFELTPQPTVDDVRLGLTGNLCRCTGYVSILEAAASVNVSGSRRMADLYGPEAILSDLKAHTPLPVFLEAQNTYPAIGPARRTFHAPRKLAEALTFKARNPEAVIVSGNTELGVVRNKKGHDPATLLSLTHIAELSELTCADGVLSIGANVTWTELERLTRALLPEFYKIIIRFGAPQIRNVATLVANVANGSPIADSLPLLFITEAEVELASIRGTRRVRLDRFYTGYKKKDLAPEEIITRVLIPLPPPDDLLRLYKVSKRNDLDIATFGAGIRIQRSGEHIARAWVSYSGVAATVVRMPDTEAFLHGKPFTEETFESAGQIARQEVRPISDVRGSDTFRAQLAENTLVKFWWDCEGAVVGGNGRMAKRER